MIVKFIWVQIIIGNVTKLMRNYLSKYNVKIVKKIQNKLIF